MSKFAHRSIFALLASCAVFGLTACGDSHTRVTTGTYAGESGASAPYLDVGPLVYQVQLSRQLNPYDTEDSSYLEGLTPAQRQLRPGEAWFAVFMQVYNRTDLAHRASTRMTISDTQGNRYFPIVPNQTNPFAYRGGLIGSKQQLPELDTVAAEGPTQGALLLYKIHLVSLDNRPLELKIVDPLNPTERASAELDV